MLWRLIVAEGRRRPGEWFLALPAVPLSTVRSVRERRHPDLHLDTGRLIGEARNTYTHDGKSFADLYVRYLED